MRIVLVLCLLTLTACAGWDDPAVLRSQAAAIERQQRQATAQARAYAAEQEAQYQAATAEAEAASLAEIEAIRAAGSGTATAIMAREQMLAIAQQEAQATREAGEYALSATATRMAYDATQAAVVLGMAYEPTRIAQAQMRDDIINRGLSLSLIVLMVLLVVLAWILVAFVRNWLGWKIEWQDRKNSLIATPDGTVKVENGEMSLVRDDGNRLRQLVRQSRTTEIQEAEYLPATYTVSDPAPRRDPLKEDALRLLEWVQDDGRIPGHREINWSSSTWQKAIGYFRALDLVEKSGDGWELRAGVREVRFQLTSPTPSRGR